MQRTTGYTAGGEGMVTLKFSHTGSHLVTQEFHSRIQEEILIHLYQEIIKANDLKQHKCPLLAVPINKLWLIYIREYYTTARNEWNLALCHNMDEQQIHNVEDKANCRRLCIVLCHFYKVQNKHSKQCVVQRCGYR